MDSLVRNNPVLSVVRSAVSQDRTRFKDHDSNLDLTYITDNLIAMGFPASGLESAWRNHIDEVSNMLNRYHGLNNILIFNLSDRKYDYEKFRNQIVEFGFPDHYSPPLDVLFQIVLAIDNWLKSSPKHVAVVHCMGGKGRTGTVVVCWLMLAGLSGDARSAFEYFASKRSKITKGVTQASQKRYVAYFEDICRKRKAPKPKRFILQRIEISPVPQFGKKRPGCKPRLEVCSTRSYPESMLWNNPFVRYHDQSEGKIVMDLGIKIMGDTLIRCVHMRKSGERTKVFRVAFHTAFVVAGAARLGRDDLDDIGKIKGGSKDKHGSDFSVTLFFVDDPMNEKEIEQELLNDIPALYHKLWGEGGLKPSISGQNTPLLHTEPDLPSAGAQMMRASNKGVEALMQAPVNRNQLMSVNLSPKWDVSPFTIPTTKDKEAASKEAASAQSNAAKYATLRGNPQARPGPSPLSQSARIDTSQTAAYASGSSSYSPSSPLSSSSPTHNPSPLCSPRDPFARSDLVSTLPPAGSFGRTSPSRSPRTSPSRPAANHALIGASPARMRGSGAGEARGSSSGPQSPPASGRANPRESSMLPESSSNRLLLNLLASPSAPPTDSPPAPAVSPKAQQQQLLTPDGSTGSAAERRRSVREQVDTLNRSSSEGRKNSNPATPTWRTKEMPTPPAGVATLRRDSAKPMPSPPSRASQQTGEEERRERTGSVIKKQLPPTPGTLRRETPSKPPKPNADVLSAPGAAPSTPPGAPSPAASPVPLLAVPQPSSSLRSVSPPPSPHRSPRSTPLPPLPANHKRSPSSGSVLLARTSAASSPAPSPGSSGSVPGFTVGASTAPALPSPLATASDRPVPASRFLLNDLKDLGGSV